MFQFCSGSHVHVLLWSEMVRDTLIIKMSCPSATASASAADVSSPSLTSSVVPTEPREALAALQSIEHSAQFVASDVAQLLGGLQAGLHSVRVIALHIPPFFYVRVLLIPVIHALRLFSLFARAAFAFFSRSHDGLPRLSQAHSRSSQCQCRRR